jgi:5-methylcytosine-specific restriction endonuclease McrA
MTYQEQLQTPEWRRKRKAILLRDHLRCQRCGNANLVNQSRFVALASFRETEEWNVISYGENNKNSFETKFISREHAIVNPAVSKLDLLTPKVCVHSFEGTDYLAGVKLHELDWEAVARAAIENLVVARWSRVSPEAELSIRMNLKEREEAWKLREWYFVPGLNTHHLYYKMGKNAWEYPDDALQTLCRECHLAVHQEQVIPYYSRDGMFIINLTPCDRCGGHGIIPPYSHVQDGICFKCKGARYLELIQ